jgi:hypothetical protein
MGNKRITKTKASQINELFPPSCRLNPHTTCSAKTTKANILPSDRAMHTTNYLFTANQTVGNRDTVLTQKAERTVDVAIAVVDLEFGEINVENYVEQVGVGWKSSISWL